MRVVIINDTGAKAHFGCRLVMSAYRKLVQERDIELVGTQKIRSPWHSDSNRKMLDRADLVIVNGEGSIHHNRFTDLLEVADEYPSILVNCVFEEMDCSAHLGKFKHVAVRESMSARYMETQHCRKPEIVPDLMFAHTEKMRQLTTYSQDAVFVSDSVVDLGSCTAPIADDRYVNSMSDYRRACCGRFHAICAAAMLGMPFSAWPSNTWKNKGIMADMGISELYADQYDGSARRMPVIHREHAMRIVPDQLSDSVVRYVDDAVTSINNLFDRVASGAFC